MRSISQLWREERTDERFLSGLVDSREMQPPTRMHRIGIGALLACLIGCGAEPEAAPTAAPDPAPEPEAPAPEIPRAPRPTHGGTVVDLGSYFVEVLTRDANAVDVLTLGDERPDPGQTYATVWLTGPDGALHPVVLTWDPVSERYRGLLRGILPIPGPIRVAMITGAQQRSGEASTLVVSGARSGDPTHSGGGGRRSAVGAARTARATGTRTAATPERANAPLANNAAGTAPLAFEAPSIPADALTTPASPAEPAPAQAATATPARATPGPTPSPTPTLAPAPTPAPSPAPTPATPPPRATVRVIGPRVPETGRAVGRPQIRNPSDRASPSAPRPETRREATETDASRAGTERGGASVRPR